MSNIRLDKKEVEDLIQKFSDSENLVRERMSKYIQQEMARLSADVKENQLSGQSLGVQTGTLRRSITFEVNQSGDVIEGSVGTNVLYGIYWENGFTKSLKNGTSKTYQRPFLKPAADRFAVNFEQRATDRLEQIIKSIYE